MSKGSAKKVRQVVERLKQYGPEKIILFGSMAWGKPGPASDVDVLIIKNEKKPIRKRMREVHSLWKFGDPAVDAIVLTPKELQKKLEQEHMFYRRIVRDGKVIYDSTKKRSR
ncbi:MAG: nucleotidyltransferase domain-containing protein [bacterium]|nr:nucleotidyltransferase domain-containing protein [bacterium]